MPGQIFCCLLFFVGIEEKRFDSTLSNRYHNCESRPPTKSTDSFHVDTITKRRKEAKRDKKKIGVGTSVTVTVGEINEKIREGKSRSTRKDMVGLYYLSHIASYLVLSQFWWLVPVFSIVYRW